MKKFKMNYMLMTTKLILAMVNMRKMQLVI